MQIFREITASKTGFSCSAQTFEYSWDCLYLLLLSKVITLNNDKIGYDLCNRWSLGDFTKIEGTQMEMFNFLWLIWDHYLPLTATKNNLPPWHPQGGVQIYPKGKFYYTKPWTQKYPCTYSNFYLFFPICKRKEFK